MPNTFMYNLETGQTPSLDIVFRSAQWRRLRQALTDLAVDDWLKVTVNSDQGIPHQKVAERMRMAVYSFKHAAKETLNDIKFVTRSQDNGNSTVIWVQKQRLDVVQ